jgi:hypothetical protein
VQFLDLREIIADNLSKAGWSWGCIATIDSNGRTIFIVDAHRDDGKRFIVRADERLPAFIAVAGEKARHASFGLKPFGCRLPDRAIHFLENAAARISRRKTPHPRS